MPPKLFGKHKQHKHKYEEPPELPVSNANSSRSFTTTPTDPPRNDTQTSPSEEDSQFREVTPDWPPPYSASNQRPRPPPAASPLYPVAGLRTGAVFIRTAPIKATLPVANPVHEVHVETKPDATLGKKGFKDPVKPPESNPEKQNLESDSMLDYLEDYLEDPNDPRIFGKYNCSIREHAVLLLVGRSQTGKSSTVSVLIDPQNSILSKGVSETVNPTLHSLVVYDKRNGSVFQLNVIDTPGLGEVSANDQSRSDDILLDVTKTFVKHQVTHLNMIAFVTPVGDTNLLDTKYFKLIADFVGNDFQQISCLLLSKADTADAERLSEMIEAIETSENTDHVAKFCEKGIVTIGAVNYDTLAAFEDDEELQRQTAKELLVRVGEMRQNFIQLILKSSDKRVQVAKLNDVYEEIKAAQENALRDYMSRLPSTSSSSDSGNMEDKGQTVTENNEDAKSNVKSIRHWLDENERELGLEGNFSVRTAKVVNVLLVGRSHAGKSSIVHVLLDPRISLRKSAWSSTRDAQIHRLVVEDTEAQELYLLNIIDTPGLGEAVKDYRDDSTLVDLGNLCLIYGITKLNCVAFVSPFEQTIMLDTDHFKTVKAFLGEHMSSVSMLLLTHADSYSQEFKDKYLREIKEHPKTKEMAEFCKLGVGVTVAVCLDILKEFTQNPSTLKRLVQKKLDIVAKNRCELIDTFLKCKKAVPIEALKYWDTKVIDSLIARALRKKIWNAVK